jgi:hypothetical protein
MPNYEIELFELYVSKYRIEADSEAGAIVKLYAGEGEAVDNSPEYVQVADDYGMPTDENPELVKALEERGVSVGENFISSIRSIEEVCSHEDTEVDTESNVPCVAVAEMTCPSTPADVVEPVGRTRPAISIARPSACRSKSLLRPIPSNSMTATTSLLHPKRVS